MKQKKNPHGLKQVVGFYIYTNKEGEILKYYQT